jgi:hypothetical protein
VRDIREKEKRSTLHSGPKGGQESLASKEKPKKKKEASKKRLSKNSDNDSISSDDSLVIKTDRKDEK